MKQFKQFSLIFAAVMSLCTMAFADNTAHQQPVVYLNNQGNTTTITITGTQFIKDQSSQSFNMTAAAGQRIQTGVLPFGQAPIVGYSFSAVTSNDKSIPCENLTLNSEYTTSVQFNITTVDNNPICVESHYQPL